MLRTLLFIGMGSFIGGIARFLLARWVQGGTGSSFPFGTLAVNVLGCLAIGLLYGIFERGNLMNPDLRLFLTVGAVRRVHDVLHVRSRKLFAFPERQPPAFYPLHDAEFRTPDSPPPAWSI